MAASDPLKTFSYGIAPSTALLECMVDLGQEDNFCSDRPQLAVLTGSL